MDDSETADADAASLVRRLLAAAADFNVEECDQLLEAAAARFGPVPLVGDVMAPVLREAGNRWHKGEFSVVQEHLITGAIRRRLYQVLDRHGRGATGPVILFTTLSGEHHEIGVLMAAVVAASRGFRCIYLGPDLPVGDICEFCARRPVAALALSLVTHPDVTDVAGQLDELRATLPASVEIWVGGRAAALLTRKPVSPGIFPMPDLATFSARLSALSVPTES